MERIATVRWHTPAPTSVDEELAIFADGRARLLVARPRDGGATVGAFAAAVDASDARALGDRGTLDIDLLAPAGADATRLVESAERVAAAARERPLATATFAVRPIGASGADRVRVALVVTGGGTEPVQLELSAGGSALHFARDGREVAWRELPPLEVGFVTGEAVGLGGLRRRAVIAPGVVGAISLDVEAHPGADAVAVQVAGLLYGGLPDQPEPRAFEIRTPPASLAG